MDPIDYTPAHYDGDSSPLWHENEGHVASAGYYALCILFSWLVLPVFMGPDVTCASRNTLRIVDGATAACATGHSVPPNRRS